ncbi:MAG TPA: hypothetical protein VEI57_10835 [Nitrospirota bacterium]|nr:hypothetical protein [Nitrospirota bacterium]
MAQEATQERSIELLPLITLVAIPFGWYCAGGREGAHAMTGLMLLAVGDVASSPRWRATL